MTYDSRYGVTKIINEKYDNLSVSLDESIRSDGEIVPVFLYTPDMDNTREHFHVELTRSEAENLKEWLEKYLTDENIYGKFKRDLKK